MASWLECSNLDQVVLVGDIVLCSWARHFTLTVPLSTQVYKWVPAKCWGVTLRWTSSAGKNFSLFRGHMSFQIFLLVGHLTNWTGHNLLTDNTLKKTTQDVLVTCSVIVSDHNVKLAGHFQNLVGQCPMTDCYFQH